MDKGHKSEESVMICGRVVDIHTDEKGKRVADRKHFGFLLGVLGFSMCNFR
jgi:hypothetical protein